MKTALELNILEPLIFPMVLRYSPNFSCHNNIPYIPPIQQPWKTQVRLHYSPTPIPHLTSSAVSEIPHVIHLLTQSKPSVQRSTIEYYFTANASFQHPFCRTGSFEGSRWLLWCIYRWYKIMSPRIEMNVDSVGIYVLMLLKDGEEG